MKNSMALDDGECIQAPDGIVLALDGGYGPPFLNSPHRPMVGGRQGTARVAPQSR